ncbi:MAG: site-specific integrase [Gammaproteobacteria bacterium]|nr:site-specific integrase [Gammaproteobacteria bacterium]
MGRRDWGSGAIEGRSRGRWRVAIELPRDPATGRRRRRRFTVRGTKRDAQRALRQALHERDHGGVDPDRITTGEWLEHWIQQRAREGSLAPGTVEAYRSMVRAHLVPALGPVRLQELRAAHVRALKDDLSQARAPATVWSILRLLRQVLQSAVTQELLARNPAAAVPNPSRVRGRHERRALTEAEIVELLRVAGGTAYDMVIRFALATGARRGELLGARWDAIDLERRVFRVTRTLQVVRNEIIVRPPKTARSRRAIELSPLTLERLRRHRAEQNAARLRLGPAWEDHDLVFPGEGGRYWVPHRFYAGFRELVSESKVERPREVNFHTLRHTAASQWILAGVDLLTVSRRLGHTQASFTMDVYGHMLPGQQYQAAEALDHLLG